MKLHSYVVRYDSGFAPNPFYEYCTLATCKPKIRSSADIGDWLLGSGSADRTIKRGAYLVYAMRVTETLSFSQFNADPRFQRKKPYRFGSRMQSCGDNIYYQTGDTGPWQQRDSFHSNSDGSPSTNHIAKDTGTNRILVSSDYVYFGGYGPSIPLNLTDSNGLHIRHSGIGHKTIEESLLIHNFEAWIRSLGVNGYQSAPYEWRTLRGEK